MHEAQLFYYTTRIVIISYGYAWHTVTSAFKTPLFNAITLVNG